MNSIYLKELKSFFSSLAGYVVLLVFIIITGLLLWVLSDTNILNNANILDYGYASMEQFFAAAPIVLLFLIPAITMKTFADEYKGGTIEWLFTKPLKMHHILLGKYFAVLSIAIIALIPTLIYLVSINWLAVDGGALDFGGILGSYIGLLLLVATFCSIGIFSSSLTDNQIVSFLIALVLSATLYSGFEGLSRIPAFRGNSDYILELIGMDYHYTNLSRGVIDTRDIVYFISAIVLFNFLTYFSIEYKRAKS
jgi:ABC-2 type transport system permease protein